MRFVAAVVVVAFAPGAFGSAILDEAKRYSRDFKAVVLAPAHWNRTQWGGAALTIGTIAILMREDEHIAHSIQARRNSSTDSVAMIGLGLVTKNHELRDTGRDAFESEIIAAGVITPLLKRAFGRARPNQDETNSHDFDPFSAQESFPSGHSTNAFALASAVAGHSRGWVVPTIAYTVATSVAFARMNDNVHWASDVLAGAAIGTATGHMIVQRHRPSAQHAEWSIIPTVGRRGAGFVVHITIR
ncbi:MAG: hypothetical protein DMF59_19560 [Acidobacteria bacterium]|nr:MAG: hypothetical protein DMF59_19560 [Acidobacteriota bacterium]